MESVQRTFLLLRPGAPQINPQSRAMLKLQSMRDGLLVQLTASGLPSGAYALYLFLQDGAPLYAGDVAGGSLQRLLPGVRLQNIWGAAVIHTGTLAFCLKSTRDGWDSVAARFKLIHASRPSVTPTVSDGGLDAVAPPEDSPQPLPDETQPPPDETQLPPFSRQPPAVSTEAAPLDIEAIEPDEADDTGVCESCPHAIRQDRIHPFPSVFPHSEWVKISYPGPTGWWHYITGRVYSGPEVVAKAVGVPGEYGMAPPVWLEGFGTYMRCVTPDAHGYWLMFQDPQTGEILDMGLSPRDA